jgi:hypothetical protein
MRQCHRCALRRTFGVVLCCATALFAGDTLKFEIENGETVGVSCHKAFHKQIPLSRKEIENIEKF